MFTFTNGQNPHAIDANARFRSLVIVSAQARVSRRRFTFAVKD